MDELAQVKWSDDVTVQLEETLRLAALGSSGLNVITRDLHRFIAKTPGGIRGVLTDFGELQQFLGVVQGNMYDTTMEDFTRRFGVVGKLLELDEGPFAHNASLRSRACSPNWLSAAMEGHVRVDHVFTSALGEKLSVRPTDKWYEVVIGDLTSSRWKTDRIARCIIAGAYACDAATIEAIADDNGIRLNEAEATRIADFTCGRSRTEMYNASTWPALLVDSAGEMSDALRRSARFNLYVDDGPVSLAHQLLSSTVAARATVADAVRSMSDSDWLAAARNIAVVLATSGGELFGDMHRRIRAGVFGGFDPRRNLIKFESALAGAGLLYRTQRLRLLQMNDWRLSALLPDPQAAARLLENALRPEALVEIGYILAQPQVLLQPDIGEYLCRQQGIVATRLCHTARRGELILPQAVAVLGLNDSLALLHTAAPLLDYGDGRGQRRAWQAYRSAPYDWQDGNDIRNAYRMRIVQAFNAAANGSLTLDLADYAQNLLGNWSGDAR